jgi:hypothetical protein
VFKEHISSRRRGRRSRVSLPEVASRLLVTSALTIALSLLALLSPSLVPRAAASTPQPDPYPTRAARIVVTPTPDPAPAAMKPPTTDPPAPVQASKPVVTAHSVVSAASPGTSATTKSLHKRQEAPSTRKKEAPSTRKKTGAEGRPATGSEPVRSRPRTAPGLDARGASASTVTSAAAEADGLRLLPPAIALLALVIASGCLVQLLARSDGGRARV